MLLALGSIITMSTSVNSSTGFFLVYFIYRYLKSSVIDWFKSALHFILVIRDRLVITGAPNRVGS
ncbi:hypothetical protein L208DRAFT_718368 [Tricholoma matsutake]|nr:hypothetical protein L208DRAFT_718368 [Tricholoma matsutake 945]